MIFSPARYIVIDDKIEHLNSIIQAFKELGTYCLGIHYSADKDLDQNIFQGVRCLFMDLHLIEGTSGTDNKKHYSQIAQILEDCININGGPFILIIWTEHPQLGNELRDFLDNKLDPEKPHSRPLAVLALDKANFINLESGSENNNRLLASKIKDEITKVPQLAALLSWEMDVLRAAGTTLASLLALIPCEKRNSEYFQPNLDEILSRLAAGAVGKDNVDSDKRASINTALSPILNDRIMNQEVDVSVSDIWQRAITRHNDKTLPKATPEEASVINRMLHIANTSGETINPTDWGAVIDWPFDDIDKSFSELMGGTKKDILCQEFKLRSKSINDCGVKLLRVGAACDYAQKSSGPITYLLIVEIPTTACRQLDNANNPVKLSDAIWKSPKINIDNYSSPVELYIHQRFQLSFTRIKAESFVAKYRIREQMLISIISSSSNYTARPGILYMP